MFRLIGTIHLFQDDGVLIKPEPFLHSKNDHDNKQRKKVVFIQSNTTLLAVQKIIDNLKSLEHEVFENVFSVKLSNSFLSLFEDVLVRDPTSDDLLRETLKVRNNRKVAGYKR